MTSVRSPGAPLPRYLAVFHALKEDLQHRRFPGGRLPSEPELERRFRVSRITLRHAIRLLCQEGLVEKRQGSGTFIREAASADACAKPTRLVCLLSRHVNGGWQDPFFAPIVTAIQREAAGLRFKVETHRDGPHSPAEWLKTNTPGDRPLFIFIGQVAPSFSSRLGDRGLRVVQVDGTGGESARLHLRDDERAGARLLAAALKRRPFKRVLFLSGRENPIWQRRLSCLSAELLQASRALRMETLWAAGGTDETARGYRAVKQHFAGRAFPHDLLMGVSDRLALGAMKALEEMGLACPRDVAVTGYDGLATRKEGPSLTTLCVDREGMGRQAVRMGLRMLEASTDVPLEIFLPPILRIGGSI